MKQTAVEWLIEQVNSDEYQKAFGQTYISIALLEQAIAIEKEQIKRAYAIGFYDAWYNVKHNDELLYTDAKHYYNENYETPHIKNR